MTPRTPRAGSSPTSCARYWLLGGTPGLGSIVADLAQAEPVLQIGPVLVIAGDRHAAQRRRLLLPALHRRRPARLEILGAAGDCRRIGRIELLHAGGQRRRDRRRYFAGRSGCAGCRRRGCRLRRGRAGSAPRAAARIAPPRNSRGRPAGRGRWRPGAAASAASRSPVRRRCRRRDRRERSRAISDGRAWIWCGSWRALVATKTSTLSPPSSLASAPHSGSQANTSSARAPLGARAAEARQSGRPGARGSSSGSSPAP